MKATHRLLSVVLCTLSIAGCKDGKLSDANIFDPQKNDVIDRDAHLSRDDFRTMRDIEPPKRGDLEVSTNVIEPPIPQLAEILAAPQPPKIGATKLVSVAVTDDVPIKDVLLELARLANVDIDVDASITGGVALRATDRPFNEVVERIADLAGLRYTMKDGVLRVERDTPYIQLYSLDLLNIDRSSQSNINSNSSSSAASGSGSSSGGSSSSSSSSGGSTGGGSSSSITYKTDSDFWNKFEASIAQIMNYQPASRTSATTIASPPAQATPAAPAAPGGNGASPQVPSPFAASAPATPSPAPAPAVSSNNAVGGSYYIVNRQAGTLTVNATDKQHELVRKFLTKIVQNTSSQVLIEAKIVEVQLNNNYQSGINWTKFGTQGGSFSFAGNFSDVKTTNTNLAAPTLSLTKNDILRTGMDLSAAVRLLDEFGTTRSLSSPRLNAVNNQQAVLSFVENIVYFDLKIKVTPAVTNGNTVTPATIEVTKEQKTVPEGIVLSLQPSVSQDTSEVTLSIRPTLTKVTKFVTDPSYPIQAAVAVNNLQGASQEIIDRIIATESLVPQVESRELDSIVKVKSGETLVIGGLLEDQVTNQDAGVPFASEIPWVGNLFKSVDKVDQKKELVIFLRATIVGTSGNADAADKAIYEKFIKDPRPLKF